jgi:hypothetical protein
VLRKPYSYCTRCAIYCILPESLLLFSNEFTGEIPKAIGNLRLRELLAQNNMLDGRLPEELFANIDLTFVRLDNNNFSGPISSSIGDLKQLVDLRLNNNSFSGQLPVSLWALNKLRKYSA